MARGLAILLLIAGLLCSNAVADTLDYLREEALEGDPISQVDLGRAYFNGDEITRDYKQAYIWYYVAAESGYEDAARSRDETAEFLSAEELQAATAAAADLAKSIYGQ